MYTSSKTKNTKASLKQGVCSHFAISQSTPFLGVVSIKDEAGREFIAQGLSAIGIGAIILGEAKESKIQNVAYAKTVYINDIAGVDFFVFDGESDDINVMEYMKAGAVPILPQENIFSGIIKPFNPMVFEGNGFLFPKNNPYCIFERIVAFLENVRFPEDRRILYKNVRETF